MRRWRLAHPVAVAAAVALAAEWMRARGWVLAAGLVLLAVLAVAAAWADGHEAPGRGARRLAAALVIALAAVAVATTFRLGRLRGAWPDVREREVTSASLALNKDLASAFATVQQLAERTAPLASERPEDAFARLAAVVGDGAPARGVVLFDTLGRPRAWAGLLRVSLGAAGPELSTITTPFYLWLVARRQAPGGGTAVAAVLLARASNAPQAGIALTDRFAERAGVGLHFYQPGGAPADSDVFDYVLPRGLAGGDTLFAVQPMPPEQDAAVADLAVASQRWAFWLVVALLVTGALSAARAGLPAVGVAAEAPAFALFLARAPLGDAFGPGGLFSSATYFQSELGPYSSSAGTLILTGIAVAVLASALWRAGLRPRWASAVLALVLIGLAPYLLQDLARGITPPATGVSLGLWLTWQIALVLAASALVLLAAALVRGPAVPRHAGVWPFLASLLAIALAVAGLYLWEPRGAWPAWYPYLWLPALLVAVKPMPFRSTIATVAIVAGSAAALLEWGATTESRIALASRDAEGLGDQADPLKVALFDRLVHGVPPDLTPQTAGDLYLLWRRSDFAAHDYPGSLGLWSAAGRRLVSLDLSQLDLPDTIVAAQVREAIDEHLPLVRSYLRVPGVYGLATIPLADGRAVSVGVGPRTSLLPPTRVARFLAGGSAGGLDETEPPYRLTLSPPEPRGPPPEPGTRWVRSGWTVRGERVVRLPGTLRHVHAQVDLGGLSALLQRGLLLLVMDFGVLAGLWLVVGLVGGQLVPAAREWLPRLHHSLRARLTASLAAFFVVPTVVFAAWSYARQGDEFRRSRELLIARTLSDAGAALEDERSDTAQALLDVAQNVDAELVLSRGGELVALSAPVLRDLGLVDWLVPPAAFTRLVYGDYLQLTAVQANTPQPVLVGYRLLGGGGGDAGGDVGSADAAGAAVLSSPQLLTDETLGEREKDLAVAVADVAVLGMIAAVVLSGLAARALARPLKDLASAALEAGAGQRPATPPPSLPSELEPVYRAIEQAAGDVEKGQEAQRILAWGAMARQVAHEIKNPLTPIRLGIQHLMRVHNERPEELPRVLSGTGRRILAEIDRLDAIARTFSRFALPAPTPQPLETVDATDVVREVVGLYRLGEAPTRWVVEDDGAAPVRARRDELVEVLVNLLENARDAGAAQVTTTVVRLERGAGREAGGARIAVRDDGRGIPAESLPRVFEPRFSTTTSGSGLGLAIAKRLVEGWGGVIGIESVEGAGTSVTLTLCGPGSDGGV